MRGGRAFAVAVLASIGLHALLLAALPGIRELAALIPPEPEPLIARIARLAPPPPPVKPAVRQEAPRPAPKRAPVAKPEPRPAPVPRPAPIVIPPPAAPAEPAPMVQAPEPAPAPAPSPAPPIARIDPRLLLPEAPAPDPARAGALERYREELVRVASDFKRYPRVAVDNNWEGEVVVRLALDAEGRIASLSVARGSGYAVLDRQALQMFEAAKPLVQIPAALRGKAFKLELRAIYNLRDQRSG
jgi:periplasmic protein TonB